MIKLLSAINPRFQNALGNIVCSMVTWQPMPLQIAFRVLLGDHKILIKELYNYDLLLL